MLTGGRNVKKSLLKIIVMKTINEQIAKKRQNLSRLLNSIEEFKDNFEIISYGEKTVFASKDFSKHFEIKNTKTSIYNYDESTIILIEEFNSEELEKEKEEKEKFAIEFSEWLFINFPNQYKVYQYGEKDGFYTIDELLEQYKNQITQ